MRISQILIQVASTVFVERSVIHDLAAVFNELLTKLFGKSTVLSA